MFNWVIDMMWRFFGTTLGMSMSTYEDKIALTSSRFYAISTEDFMYPLRETCMYVMSLSTFRVNAKDNLIFQWILGRQRS
jgi:hypothetical protein